MAAAPSFLPRCSGTFGVMSISCQTTSQPLSSLYSDPEQTYMSCALFCCSQTQS